MNHRPAFLRLRTCIFGLTVLFSVPALAGVCLAERAVTILWDKVYEPELEGYKVYYKPNTPGEPYDGEDADQGPSPIVIPLTELESEENPSFTLTGLTRWVPYYFVVTAYDNRGLESEYSEEVRHCDPGDVNGRDGVTAQDAVDAFWMSLMPSWSDDELCMADYNKNGEITAEDAISIWWAQWE